MILTDHSQACGYTGCIHSTHAHVHGTECMLSQDPTLLASVTLIGVHIERTVCVYTRADDHADAMLILGILPQ